MRKLSRLEYLGLGVALSERLEVRPCVGRFLATLVASPGAPVNRLVLGDAIAVNDESPSSGSLSVYATWAREAMNDIGLTDCLKGVWGKGYELSPDAAQALLDFAEGRHDT